jgi:hypothetical protein
MPTAILRRGQQAHARAEGIALPGAQRGGADAHAAEAERGEGGQVLGGLVAAGREEDGRRQVHGQAAVVEAQRLLERGRRRRIRGQGRVHARVLREQVVAGLGVGDDFLDQLEQPVAGRNFIIGIWKRAAFMTGSVGSEGRGSGRRIHAQENT